MHNCPSRSVHRPGFPVDRTLRRPCGILNFLVLPVTIPVLLHLAGSGFSTRAASPQNREKQNRGKQKHVKPCNLEIALVS